MTRLSRGTLSHLKTLCYRLKIVAYRVAGSVAVRVAISLVCVQDHRQETYAPRAWSGRDIEALHPIRRESMNGQFQNIRAGNNDLLV